MVDLTTINSLYDQRGRETRRKGQNNVSVYRVLTIRNYHPKLSQETARRVAICSG